ncbi:hypothetical protein SNE26_17520 [Mucilaginibacter sp. cycad4]|uniref:hypothetical protein n=1 Tax=Mucilaginibacter sp. cycad4 TaxID=3342096 RepID=UPI002AAB9F79|nr:hypothetical protein [Mucilaginibacter gossypii]WPU97829.1 hypothetical protein SNE26_17520 [Mucilaginibacter gossypii]
MKTAVTMMIGMLCIAACQSKSSKNQVFIDGIYVNHTKGEYAVADDTLIFTHTDVNHYSITRNTGYQAIRDGRLLPKKHQVEKLEGNYDEKSGVLNETTTGRVFRFDPDEHVLLLKQAVYRKLN